MMKRIHILHISDLHFGSQFVQRGAFPQVQGLQPHDLLACEDLERVWKRITLRDRPDASVIVASGDLTIRGGDAEFVQALTYLRGTLRTQWRLSTGLGGSSDLQCAVPGNHDHWEGRSSVFGVGSKRSRRSQRGLHGRFFESVPGHSCWAHAIDKVQGLRLELMGLDSNAGPSADLLATGSIDSDDIVALDNWLDAQPAEGRRTARVLVFHHSLESRGMGGRMHQLHPNSRREIVDFCQRRKVNFLMTGHMHEPIVPAVLVPAPTTLGSKRAPLGVELRCGTTLQRARLAGKLPTRSGHTFLLHTLSLPGPGAALQWRTRLYRRADPAFGFRVDRSRSYRADL